MKLLLYVLILQCCCIWVAVQAVHYRQRGGEVCLNLTASPYLTKFVDALPIMPTINLRTTPRITIGVYKITQKLHRDLPPTTLYAYGTSYQTAMYPGPTLLAEVGYTAYVRWENHIPDKEHMLPVDRTLDWANPQHGYVPMVVHLHGQEDEGWSDGHPQAWFTPVGEHGPTFVSQDYVYPNDQRPALLWYHDHVFGITRLNMVAGQVGAYVIESQALTPTWVPRTYYVLVIQDKAFYDDGFIKYPDIGINPPVHPQWCPDYFGDVVLVNGKAWPYLDVAPTVYRFRLVNAGNSRFHVLVLNDPRLRFIKIGVDGGYLTTPIAQQQMRVGPAERVDFLIDFSNVRRGRQVELRNIGAAPFPNGTATNQSVMLFRVFLSHGNDERAVALASMPQPLTPEALARMSPFQIARETAGVDLSHEDWYRIYNRPFMIDAQFDSGGGLVALFLQDRLHFDDPVTELMKLYTTEVWALINTETVTHPIHLHLVNFLVVQRQQFDPDAVENKTCSFDYNYPDRRSCYTAFPEGPDADQVGFKDTAAVLPFYVTRFYVVFNSNLLPRYRIDPTKFPGYVWHCHLLEHEDNEMMRPEQFSYTKAIYPNISFPPGDISGKHYN